MKMLQLAAPAQPRSRFPLSLAVPRGATFPPARGHLAQPRSRPSPQCRLGPAMAPPAGRADDRSGRLAAAARRGRAAVVERLLLEGTAVNQHGPKGTTALRAAVEAGHALIAQMLLRHGAELDIALFEELARCHCSQDSARRRVPPAVVAGSARAAVPPRTFEAIDLAPFVRHDEYDDEARQRSARLWDESFRTIGFALVDGHGVCEELVADLRTAATMFFNSTSDHKHRYYRGPKMTGRSGYSPVGAGQAANVHLDPLEGYTFIRSESRKWSNIEETHPEELDGISQRYCYEVERVMHALHRMSAVALGLDINYFDQFYNNPASVLVISHYPPLRSPLEVKEGKLRYRAHSDYSGFTILLQDEGDFSEPGAGGLEIDVGGIWVPVKPRKGAFVVNIGDLFETWTNDRWRSTPHRVSSPVLRSRSAGRSRLTVMLFSGPSLDSIIEPISTCIDAEHPCKYAAVKASDHLTGMYKSKSKEAIYKPG